MVTFASSTIHTRIWFFEYTTRRPTPDKKGTPVSGGAATTVVVGASEGGGGRVGVSWMLLPRVAGAGASAASTLLATGASTAPPSPAMVVVVGPAGVAEATAGNATAPTHSAATPTVSATTPTLDFISRTLAGLLPRVESRSGRRQPDLGQERSTIRHREGLDATGLGDVRAAGLDGRQGFRRAAED